MIAKGLGRRDLGFVVLAVVVAACGGSSSSPSTPSGGGGSTAATCGADGKTIVISNNTVCPTTLTVALGTQVTFVNNDARSHNMTSDPHPEHTDCPPLNDVGFLAAGQTRQSGNLVTARTCGFHDHDNFQLKSLQGSITIR